ncbi:hypothetical protein PQX77_012980 [Marasmius sp. AFHP31]|nr:hypothetical protein PQX77_012980 [Marasmius sp. AFHP31]
MPRKKRVTRKSKDVVLSTRRPAPDLPLEVVSLIMEEFDEWSERETLKACSLVSWVWKQAAQPRIFTHIEITNGVQCKFWSKKIKEFPHLGPYVKKLSLSDPDDDCMGRPYLRGRAAKTLLSSLTSLRRLELDDFKRWGPVEQRLVKGLRTVQSLRVDEIPGMSRSRDLPDLYYTLSNVEDFTPGEVGEEYDETKVGPIRESGIALRGRLPEGGKARNLRELVLFDAQIGIDKLMWLTGPAFDLSTLRHLSLSWGDFFALETVPYFTALDDLLRLVGEHVEDLHLDIPLPFFYDEIFEPILLTSNPLDLLSTHFSHCGPLRSFTALKRVTFATDIEECSISLALNTMLGILKTLAAPHLEVIGLETGLFAPCFQIESALGEIADWKALDDLVVGKSFPSLRSLIFRINMRPYVTSRHWETTRDIIQTSLPSAFSKDLLRLYVSSDTFE